ncbi:hypothetical protein Cgig2_029489 [Carnegiea gigantea]|uniref:Uncharacterized protein n=1 Tax=Carnegiea gigantea TaxID=171969 RepID=A0A9Q1KKX3_9CARY|nr:hypothetical protein Cgig2_029489 [Carnegiea gigantea]
MARFQAYLRFNAAHPNPNYTAPISFLLAQARSIGLQARALEFVTAKPWDPPPFVAVRNPDGKIFARGVQDDKSIPVQYLEAIRNLREVHQFESIRTVHLSCVPDEEIGGFVGAAKFVESKDFEELNGNGATGSWSRMYDNSAMEHLMKTVELMMRSREAQFHVVKVGLAANSEVISVNSVYLKSGIPSSDVSVSFICVNVFSFEDYWVFCDFVSSAGRLLLPAVDPELVRKRIGEKWAPASRNTTYQIVEKGCIRDFRGRPLMTSTDDTNPWWSVFEQAIVAVGGKLAKPEILASTTDSTFMRQRGIPTLDASRRQILQSCFMTIMSFGILIHHISSCHLQDTVFLRGIKVYESIICSSSSFEG